MLKHAGPARGGVHVAYDPAQCGSRSPTTVAGVRRPPRPTGGHGLVGMRERVGVYGGTLAPARRSAAGSGSSATLPYGEASVIRVRGRRRPGAGAERLHRPAAGRPADIEVVGEAGDGRRGGRARPASSVPTSC